jgi:tetratricopeptide (TPR) repeat protein
MLGVCYYNARRYDDAVSTLEQFVNGAGRNHAMGYFTLAQSFEKKNQYDDAIEAYEQVIKYKIFIPKSSRTKVLGDVAFSLAVCDYYRSNNTDDDEQQHRYRGNAVQGLKDFIEHYCAGNHPSCGKARELLNEIEIEN